jgi:hypothetical protein
MSVLDADKEQAVVLLSRKNALDMIAALTTLVADLKEE